MNKFFGLRVYKETDSEGCPDDCIYSDSDSEDLKFEKAKKWFRTIYLEHLVTPDEIKASRAPQVTDHKLKRVHSKNRLDEYNTSRKYFLDGNYIAHIISQYNNSLSEPYFQSNNKEFIKIHMYHTVSSLSGWKEPFDDNEIEDFENNILQYEELFQTELTGLRGGPRTIAGFEYHVRITEQAIKMITKYREEKKKVTTLEVGRDLKYTKQIKSYLINNILNILDTTTSRLARLDKNTKVTPNLVVVEKDTNQQQGPDFLLKQLDDAREAAKKLLIGVNDTKSGELPEKRGGKSRRKKSRKTKSRKRKAMKKRR